MQVEKFDFAIYGSGLDAAFLAAQLVSSHECKVLLIRDHVNDYTLQHHQDFSVGGNCDPDTIKIAHEGLQKWHTQFSGRAGRDCFDRLQVSLKASFAENAEILHYIEGALIACDRQSERKATRFQGDYLTVRDVIAPKRRAALEYLHQAYVGVGMDVLDRSAFQDARQLKDGRLMLKSGTKQYSATQTVILDEDLITHYFNAALRTVLIPTLGTKLAVKNVTKYSKYPTFCVDTQMCVRAQTGNKILVSAPLPFGDLTEICSKEVLGFEQMEIHAMGAYNAVHTKDGAPLLDFQKQKKTWVFSGGTVRTFLMPSVSDMLVGKPGPSVQKYWQARGTHNRKCGDVPHPPSPNMEFKNDTV